jgi:hypothetical protein
MRCLMTAPYLSQRLVSDRRNDVINLEKTFAGEIDSCQRNRLHLRF